MHVPAAKVHRYIGVVAMIEGHGLFRTCLDVLETHLVLVSHHIVFNVPCSGVNALQKKIETQLAIRVPSTETQTSVPVWMSPKLV